MGKHSIGRVEAFPPGKQSLVRVAGRTLGIFNINDEYYALHNLCPHNQAPVCLGDVGGTLLPSQPGEYIPGMEGEILRCPWHGWEFNIKTGSSLFDPAVKVTTYAVTVENGELVIEI
ncbi:MAG: Rieske (2Fe-2S) protein [Litorilinea sp.]